MFDAAKVREEIIRWIRDWFECNGKGCNAIVGISGGKDSSVAAALCVEAVGRERVIGVLMPNGEQSDIAMSRLLAEHLGIEHYVINIQDGARLGQVSDLEIDLCTGTVMGLMVPGERRGLGLLRNREGLCIPFARIKKFGEDVILVELCP